MRIVYTIPAEKSRGGMPTLFLSTDMLFDSACRNDTIDGANLVVGHLSSGILYVDLLEHAMSCLSKRNKGLEFT